MSKKKKKHKNDSILNEVDQSLDQTYQQLMDEIHTMRLKIEIADKKAKKKARKGKNKQGYGRSLYENDDYRRQIRRELISEIEGNSFLDRVSALFNDIAPIVIIIARLVASLILAILSIDAVKVNMKPELLKKMTDVYSAAMAIS